MSGTAQGHATCFVAGTLVRVGPNEKGSIQIGSKYYKPIQNLVDGDQVVAYSEAKGTLRLMPVTFTFIREAQRVFSITFADGSVVETTWSHPFRIREFGWVKAKDLKVGMWAITEGDLSSKYALLRQVSFSGGRKNQGSPLRIESIEIENKKTEVFNIEVKGDHNYFVGTADILVHNQARGGGYGNSRTNKNHGKRFQRVQARNQARRNQRSTENFKKGIEKIKDDLKSADIFDPKNAMSPGRNALEAATEIVNGGKDLERAKALGEIRRLTGEYESEVNRLDRKMITTQYYTPCARDCDGPISAFSEFMEYSIAKGQWEYRKFRYVDNKVDYYSNQLRLGLTTPTEIEHRLQNEIRSGQQERIGGSAATAPLNSLEAQYVYTKVMENTWRSLGVEAERKSTTKS